MGNGLAHEARDTITRDTRVPMYVVVAACVACLAVGGYIWSMKSDIALLKSEQGALVKWMEKMDRKLDRLLEKP